LNYITAARGYNVGLHHQNTYHHCNSHDQNGPIGPP
jgi:hypothetical protein